MSILGVCEGVAAVVGLSIPTVVFGTRDPAVPPSTEREHVELRRLANEMARRIAFDTRDWTKLKTLATLFGDGATDNFSLPVDYARMLKKARLWPSSTPYAPLSHVPDSDQWLGMEVQSFQQLIGSWTMIGEKIYIKPIMANAASVKFYYLTKDIVIDTDPGVGDPSRKPLFTRDTDEFVLDERVLELGMIWQWKANKGQPYAEDMANYETALATQAGSDKGSNILIVGAQRGSPAAAIAHPVIIVP